MIDGAKGNRSRIQLWERIFIWARSAAFHLRCEPTPQSGHRRQLRRRLAWRSRHGDWANATARLRASPPPGHRSQPSRRFLRPAGDEQTWPALTLDDEAGSPASSPHPAERRRRAPEQPAPMPSAPAPRLSAPRPTRSATRGGATVPVLWAANSARFAATGKSTSSPPFSPAFFTAAKFAGAVGPAIAPSTAPRRSVGCPR